MNKVLFWDFDGTLSYPNKSFTTALPQALSRYGYEISSSKIDIFMADFYSWQTPEIDYPERTNALWWDTHFRKIQRFCLENHIPNEKIGGICKTFREILIDVSNYKLYDDALDTLETCIRMGYKNYLITNNYPEIVDNIKKLGIASCFTEFIVSSHIGFEKPRAVFFWYAKCRACEPKKAYVIGDNPIADIQGGKAAGFPTIAVHLCQSSDADHYCQNLCDIIDIIK